MLSYDVIEHGKPLQVRLRETPQPKGREVLIRVTRSGICHSDLHIWDGYFDLGGGNKFYVRDRGCIPPFTVGHEPYGVVEALGPEATGVKIGDRRLVFPWIGCGRCPVCEAGQDNYCLSGRFLGVNTQGAYGTHVIVPDAKYLVDASGLDEAWAATLACSGLTAYSAINKLPALGPRDWVAVMGCGGLGMASIAILRAKGIENIVACDIDEGKLAEARRQGAALSLDTREPDAVARLKSLTSDGLAGAIDLVGMPATAMLAFGALRKGGRYIMCGLYGGQITLPLPPLAQRALTIGGSYVGNLAELRELVALAQSGKLKSTPVELRAPSEINRTMEELKAGKIMGRVVIDMASANG